MVASNKDRVYIALYARGGKDPNSYHWAIIVGPKIEVEGGKPGRGSRYHARQRLNEDGQDTWRYEVLGIPLAQTAMLLGRVMIGKVANGAQLPGTLAAVPVVHDDPSWDCRTWVRDAVAALETGKILGSRVTDWQRIEQTANSFIAEKRQKRRYDGSGPWKSDTVPTYDLLQEKEVIP